MKKLMLAAAVSMALIGGAAAESRSATPQARCYSFVLIWLFRVPIRVPCETVVAPPPPAAR